MVCVYLLLNFFSMLNIKSLLVVTALFSFFFTSEVVAQKINQFNENGKRTGVWKKYYNNGNLRYSGKFENGKEVGTFKFFKERASFPHIIKEFSTVSDTATVKFYTSLGQLKTQGKMIGKNRVGQWTYFFVNGKKLSEEFYTDGKLNGVLKNYYNNGKITNQTHYKNGLKDGNSKTYTDDGILIEDINYVNGKLNGLAKFYDLKGNIKEKGNFNNGKKVGKWEFYIDGQLSEKPKKSDYLKED